jgi:NADH-quinone oxidoreductase subunit D
MEEADELTQVFKVPIGPQHPALKEPANFTFDVEGEYVVDVTARVGYNHRGIEKACESQSYVQNIYLVERICGICSMAHTTTFCQAVEEIAGIQAPPRGVYIRTLIHELNRIHSHLLWLGVAGHEVGWDTLLMYVWRDREAVLDALDMLTGNRVNYAINTIGGVRRDISPEQIRKLNKTLNLLEERTKHYLKLCLNEKTLLVRAVGMGILKPDVARSLCAVGPTLRASGIKMDVRRDDPYGAFTEVPFEVITSDMCDVAGRVVVRVGETLQSINICKWLLDNLPSGDIRTKLVRKIPPGEAVMRIEAPRGELIHYIKANGTDKPERVKVRAPTLGNIPAVCEMLKGGYIADIPIVLAAIDPCFSCTDRMIFVNRKKEIGWIWSEDELKKYSTSFYAKESFPGKL